MFAIPTRATVLLLAAPLLSAEPIWGQAGTSEPAAELAHSIATLVERSAHIRRNARPSYETEALAKLGKNPKNGSYLRFDDLLATAQIRETPPILGKTGVVLPHPPPGWNRPCGPAPPHR